MMFAVAGGEIVVLRFGGSKDPDAAALPGWSIPSAKSASGVVVVAA
jgi:hypothetical protein